MHQSNRIFDTVSRGDPLNLWSGAGGRLDYQAVVDLLSFSKNDISKVAGVAKQSVRFDERIPEEVRNRLQEIANICDLVGEYFDGDAEKTALWFRTPNPMFGGISPRDMIRFGRYKKLLKYILESRDQNDLSGKTKKAKASTG